MSQDDFFAQIGIDPGPTRSQRGERSRRAARRAARRLRRRRRILTTVVLVVALTGVGVGGYLAFDNIREAQSLQTAITDYTGIGDTEVTVTIPEGATGNEIGAILVEADVVASVGAFVNAYGANANASKIQAGTYTLKTRMSAANAVAALLDPSSRSDHALTIPEGATKAQVRERLQSVGGYTNAEIDAAFADTAAIGLPEAAGGDVEGWLAPSTYDISEDATATDVVAQMVATTISRLTAQGVAAADYQAVLTKASIVEREVSSDQYYGKVARVIENRLADTGGETRGMLQMDSTVLYGLGRTGGIPSSAEIADTSNPYNTYAHAGLPPTPIGSPSEKAIAAVMNPPAGDWLYFVTVDLTTGETLFATTHEEQKTNTEKLTAYCKEHPDICSGNTATPTPTGSGG